MISGSKPHYPSEMVVWEYGVLRCWHLLPIWLQLHPHSCSSNPYSPTAFGCKAISRWRLLRHYGQAWPTHQNPLSKHNTSRKLGIDQLQQITHTHTHTHTHNTHTNTHPFNGPFSRTTRKSRYQKGKTNLDFNEARDSE